MDNGSSHCGRASVLTMTDGYPTARLIHLPVHASWLNHPFDWTLTRNDLNQVLAKIADREPDL